MSAAPLTKVTYDDETTIIEPLLVDTAEFQHIVAGDEIHFPLKDEALPIAEANEQFPDVLVMDRSSQLLKRYIKWEGFGDHHIEVYNNWILNSARNNVYIRMLFFRDGRVVYFDNLRIMKPHYTRDGKPLPMTPKLAREQGVTYGGDWYVDAVMVDRNNPNKPPERRRDVCIGTVPTMLKSQQCILHKRTPYQLALFGEDPEDPGGYFIIDGVEKVILLQEQLAVNKIFLMNMGSGDSIVARMTANTIRGTALIELALDKKTRSIVKIRFPSMKSPKKDGGDKSKKSKKYGSINVMSIFRIFGMANPAEIQSLIAMFMAPEHVKKSMLKLTRNIVDFLMFPDDRGIIMKKIDKTTLSPQERDLEVKRILENDLFPHLNALQGPDGETETQRAIRITRAKLYLLAIMVARFLEYLAGFRPLDDRDSWSNKRVEGAGRMMEQLFRNAWRKTLGIVQGAIENGNVNDLSGVVEKIKYSVITDTFHDSFITSNWGVKGTQMKNNVAQTLVRDSVVATFAHINTVDVGISRTDRQHSLRLVQNTQWGFICPCSTPEGENCLAQGTLVYDGSGQLVDIAQIKEGDIMLSINPQTYDLIETPVYRCFTRSSAEYGQPVFTIETHNGKKVTATGDHRFLTARGFLPLSEIRPNLDHLCVTYAPKPYSNVSDKVVPIMTSEYFTTKLSETTIRPTTISNYSRDLEKKGFLHLLNNDPRVPILARMLGFLLTDGNITLKNGYPAITGYFGCMEDAEEFRKDGARLGYAFKPPRAAKWTMTEAETERKITHNVIRTEYTGSLAALMICLGMPPGRKTTQASTYPGWLEFSSPLVRREFLAGMMGGDSGSIRMAQGNSYRITKFVQSKHAEFVENGYDFMRDVMAGLEEFDVETVNIREQKYAHGTSLKLEFAQNCDNILNFMYNVGYRYCKKKLTDSLRVTEYLQYRKLFLKERTRQRKLIMGLHEQGLKPKEIATRLNLPHSEVRSCVYHKSTEGTIKYEDWCNCTYAINGCLYIPVKAVTTAPDCNVCDYTTVAETHTIICGNGIVSHNCGILKNLAVTAKVSLERKDEDIIRRLIGDPSKGLAPRVSDDPNVRIREVDPWLDKIIVNGKFLGWCNGKTTRQELVNLRRNGTLPVDMSVIKENDWLYVDTGPSRLMRPVLIVDKRSQELMIDRLGLRETTNHELLNSGAMEYISAWEQEYIKIATSPDVIRKRLELIAETNLIYQGAAADLLAVQNGETVVPPEREEPLTLAEAQSRFDSAKESLDKLAKNRRYTHCELDPQSILGVSAALIPWPNHNQAPRNTYQVGMAKQALGDYHGNHLNRFDGKTKILAFPNRPIVETEMYDIIGLNDRGPGENVTIAFMAFPFTEEDSFVFKKEFLQRGGFRIVKYLTYKTVVKHSGETVEKLRRPDSKVNEPPGRYQYIQQGDKDSPINGLPMLGAPLRQGDCVIGKIQYVTSTQDLRNESVLIRVGDEGIVEKVLVTSDNKTTVVTVKLRIMRVPQEGDKFAPRNAQKGTIGLVMPEIDLPVSEHGIVPDIIVNPASIPSRMTLSYIMELLASKFGTLRGVHVNGGAFKGFNLNACRDAMKAYGFQEFGYEKMRSGTSGKPLQALIYMGPVFFQALKHHVKDKAQVRSKGSVKPMTRQPPKGRGNRGGLRLTLAVVVSKITAGPRHRGRHIQIQGNSWNLLLPSHGWKHIGGHGENSWVWLQRRRIGTILSQAPKLDLEHGEGATHRWMWAITIV